jgi:glyoxylase-like metal-dependent hydrolase (beta-lactamase superfamily II)
MQGSTVVINPPDGDMRAYLGSLRALLDEDIEWIAPGHGFLMGRPHDAIRLLIRHRQQREAKVMNALRALAPTDLATLLASVYDDVPPGKHPIAQRSLLAHLRKLEADGWHARWKVSGTCCLVGCNGPAGILLRRRKTAAIA